MTLEHLAAWVVMPLLGAALLLAFVRVFTGPGLPDRVVALDFVGSLLIAMIGAAAVMTGSAVLLDVALILALVSFLATVAFARYMTRRGVGE